MRRATSRVLQRNKQPRISIHALLAESDAAGYHSRADRTHFYPRSPCGERHPLDWYLMILENFYPRSPCGERPITCCPHMQHVVISIHALLAESDVKDTTARQQIADISIHALLAESDEYWVGGYGTANNFYPRSPCGERQPASQGLSLISLISIHALLAESDDVACGDGHKLCHFYPRSPCGERRVFGCHAGGTGKFLSTLSLRRATNGQRRNPACVRISIHALLAESDPTPIGIMLASI